MKSPRRVAAPLLTIVGLFVAVATAFAATAEDDPVAWINGTRRGAGLPSVAADPVLSATAQAWAAVLAASGSLTHRGADGSSVLDRYREQGGTDARVGEIIGAGRELSAVERAWLDSADHRRLVMEPAWTHAGWGSSVSGASKVWVVVFCQRLVADLRLELLPSGLDIAGRLLPRDAARAVLYAGLDPVEPSSWDPDSRSFSFAVPADRSAGYFRLGYVSSAGGFRLTNAFTLSPGTGSPGDRGRSAERGGSP